MTPEDKVIFDQAIAAGSTLESKSNLDATKVDATKVEASSTKVESSTPKVEGDFLKQYAEQQQMIREYQKQLESIAAEKENAAKAAQEMIEKNNNRLIRSELRAKAYEKGLVDANVIDLLPKDGLRVTEAGVEGIDEAFETYKTKYPSLFMSKVDKTPTFVGLPPSVTPPQPSVGNMDSKQLMAMSKKEYEKFKASVLSKL